MLSDREHRILAELEHDLEAGRPGRRLWRWVRGEPCPFSYRALRVTALAGAVMAIVLLCLGLPLQALEISVVLAGPLLWRRWHQHSSRKPVG